MPLSTQLANSLVGTFYSFLSRNRQRGGTAGLLLWLLSGIPSWGQTPTLLTRQPVRNTYSAAPTDNIVLGFSQPITAASAGNLRVVGSQRWGSRVGSLTGGGTATLTFDPAQDFAPGEQVSVTVPATVLGTNGSATPKQVYQFRAAAGGTGQANFPTNTSMAVTPSSQVMALGDLDNDGDLDLVTGSYYSNMTIRINDGSGTFSSRPDVLLTVTAVALGDVDGDGDLDLLASELQGSVTILLNSGTGTFTLASSVALPNLAHQLVLADVDADGDQDVLASHDGGYASLLLNNGTGTLTSSSSIYSLQNRVWSIAVGDVDNDGDLDLALGCVNANHQPGNVTISLNNGNGVFTSLLNLPAATDPVKLQLGDLDGDGDLDLVANNTPDYFLRTVPPVSVWRNNGAGSFGAMSNVTTGGVGLTLADFDADGDLDLATTNGARLNDGQGNFIGFMLLPGLASGSPQEVLAGDLDGDLDLDLLVETVDNATAVVQVYPNQRTAAPSIAYLAPPSGPVGTSLAIAGQNFIGTRSVTLNGVPLPGFVVNSPVLITVPIPAGATSGAITVTTPAGTATSSGIFTVTLPVAVTGVVPARGALAAAPTAAVAISFAQAITSASAAGLVVHGHQRRGKRPGTLTGGGTATITLTPTQSFAAGERVSVSIPASLQSTGGGNVLGQVYQFTTAAPGPGRGTFTGNAGLGLSDRTSGTTPADVDNDGDMDLVVANTNAGTVSIVINNGNSTFSAGQRIFTRWYPYSVATADIDNDGDLDIISGTSFSGAATEVVVLRNNGSGQFTLASSIVSSGATYGRVAVGDVDADGDQDFILPSNSLTDSVRVRLNDGTGAFPWGYNVQVANSIVDLDLADVDNDGDLDLVSLLLSSTLSVQLNNGTGIFQHRPQAPVIVASSQNAYQNMALGDIDGDGDLDAVVPRSTSIGIFLNNGSGGFVAAPSIPTAGYSHSYAALGDLDADGDLDLAITDILSRGVNQNTSAISIRFNDGSGSFSGTQSVVVGATPINVVLADLDNDGDLDIATPTNTINATRLDVRWNDRIAVPAIISFAPASGLVGATVVLTGTDFIGATSVQFNGTAAPGFVINSATQITATVPPGATTGRVSVSNVAGTATSAADFTVLTLITVTSLNPARNALAVSRSGPVRVQFSQPITAASAPGLAVFGSQSGGRLSGTITGGGTAALAFTPTRPFAPGEPVSVTLPGTLQGVVNTQFPAQAYQFQAAVAGTGRGVFTMTPAVTTTHTPSTSTLADVDNDGDLDLLVLSTDGLTGFAHIRLNNGSGVFTTNLDIPMADLPLTLKVADVDNDGDLDLLVLETVGGNKVYVRLNNGSGVFSGTAMVAFPSTTVISGLATGDLDADGDLDLVTGGWDGNVYIRTNDGLGNFTGTTALFVAAGIGPGHYTVEDVQLSDMDNDGDLDLVAGDSGGGRVSVWRNNGTGQFTYFSNIPIPYGASFIETKDLDNDGDLDVVASSSSSIGGRAALLTVALNTGNGTFAAGTDLPTGITFTNYISLGDIDADGDLDLLASQSQGNTFTVWRNNGRGGFTGGVTLAMPCSTVALGDIDGDGDLDFVTGGATRAVTVAFNEPSPSITSLTPGSAGRGATVVITGVSLAGATSVTFNGVPAVFTMISATQISVVVPAGATSGLVVVTTPQGLATSSITFVVVLATRNAALAGLLLYPNPVRDVLTIAPTAGIELRTVALRDALGRQVLPEQSLKAGKLDLRSLPTGIYLLELRTSLGETIMRRISKE